MQKFVVLGDKAINMSNIWYVDKFDSEDKNYFSVKIYFGDGALLCLNGADAVEFWQKVAPDTTFRWG